MDQILVNLARDSRMVLAMFVGLLGLMFLMESASRRSTAARWLAGAALVFGCVLAAVLVIAEVTKASSTSLGLAQMLIGPPVFAAIAAGVVAMYRPQSQSLYVFWAYLVAGYSAVLAFPVLFGPSPYYAPVINAVGLSGLAAWSYLFAPNGARGGVGRSTMLGLALCTFPVAVWIGIAAGLPLVEIRHLIRMSLGVIFVVLMALILQLDARLVASELAERIKTQKSLERLNETLEHEVGRRTEQLQQINKGLQSFAGMVSHDLRAPVRNITGLTQLAMTDHEEGRHDALESLLERISQESLRANTMVSDLLNLAKTESARPILVEVDMGALVADCVRSLAMQYPFAQEVVKVESLPTLWADEGLMRHVVINLLSNALKFGADREDLCIKLSVDEAMNKWRFLIKDNGPGFEPERAEELFKPFVRLGGNQVAGTGLGLTVVQRVVELHGGEVGATSVPGCGATFWWTVPRAG